MSCNMVVAQLVVVGIVPILSACFYRWEPCGESNTIIERNSVEMTSLREFVLQPLKTESPNMVHDVPYTEPTLLEHEAPFLHQSNFTIDDEDDLVVAREMSP